MSLNDGPPKKIRVTELVLRDAHQSLLATRMRTEDMLPVCEEIDNVGYWSVECWGGRPLTRVCGSWTRIRGSGCVRSRS